jgi:hypothetical protein
MRRSGSRRPVRVAFVLQALFARATYDVPGDSGGGLPQDSYLHVTRFDYRLDDSTQIYGRYARQSQDSFAGTNRTVYTPASTPVSDRSMTARLFR